MRSLLLVVLALAAVLGGLALFVRGAGRESAPGRQAPSSVPAGASAKKRPNLELLEAPPMAEAVAGGGTGEESARLAVEESLLRLALADPGGTPLASRRLLWFLGGVSPEGAARTDGIVSTDGHGVVRLRLPKRANAWSARWLLLRSEGGVGALLDLPAELAPGENDLGSLRLAPIPAAAAGVVVDGAGAPVAGATVELELAGLDAEDPRVDRWFLTQADGRFDLRGWSAPGTAIRLQASCPGCDPIPPCDTLFGRDDVVLRTVVYGSIGGRILHGCAGAPDNLHLVAAPRQGTGKPFRESPDRAGVVLLDELPPGIYDVSVVVDGAAEPLLELPGVALRDGERVVPPALDPFDPRARLREIVVRVEGQRNGPTQATLFYRSAGDEDAPWARQTTFGEVRLVAATGALDLRATRSGSRAAERRGVAQDVTLTLEPASCRLRLRLRDPALAVSHALTVDLLAQGAPADPDLGGLIEDDGALSLRLDPGKYTAVVSALHAFSADELQLDRLDEQGMMCIQDLLRSTEVQRFELEVLDGQREQEVWIDLDAERIEHALASPR